eukprot:970813-Prymnesium_polylepis.1
MPEFELFTTADLYDDRNMDAVVTNLHSLGRLAQSFYMGPALGAKLATANPRDFTEEQLNAGKHTVGGFGLGSHASAQADAKAKLGLVMTTPAAAPAVPEVTPAPAPAPTPAPAGGVISNWLGFMSSAPADDPPA